ncbi:MAG: TRAM domain-containing protein [Acidobacteriota bacterium]|nr:TRAM domain-containing protein [Acidobacteriota bacterium]
MTHLVKSALWLRIVFPILLAALGASTRPFGLSSIYACVCGAGLGLLAIFVEIQIKQFGTKQLLGACAGVLVGFLFGILAFQALGDSLFALQSTGFFFRAALPLAGAYIGLLVGAAKSDSINLRAFGLKPSERAAGSKAEKILDTSVLIDGRIADIVESGFVDGQLIVPQFVLHELQMIADSSDSARRNRGRRGLDVVQRLQKTPGVRVDVSGQDFPAVREVDLKLIEMAKIRHAKIVTNDFNLNKVAQVQGVHVLNINELANALRPVVLPGESMRVFILKEGKEYNQGVAYLDDGTMVVVDNAKRLISKTVDVTVTSVLQTTAGKMIFGKYEERAPHSDHRGGQVTISASVGGS